jgi:hypothetical protein
MSVKYDPVSPSDEIHDIINHVVSEEFPIIAGLTTPLVINVKLVSNDVEGKPALKERGFAVDAIIRSVSECDRDITGPDVLLQLDKDHWYSLSAGDKVCLLSSKLRYLEFPGIESIEGRYQPQLDSLERVKVKVRRPDFAVAGFWETIEIHKGNAPEAIALACIAERIKQQTLPFPESESLRKSG